jgi:hypothetical protein
LIGLSDDDGVYPTQNWEDDELSLESILSGNYGDDRTHRTLSNGHHYQTDGHFRKEKGTQRSKQNMVRRPNLPDTNSSVDSTNQEHLEELAEQTYFNFLSDLMNSSKSRSLTASMEELAMHRILSERLYSYFAQPNQVKLLRNEMIAAAKDTSTSSYGKIAHRR